MAFAHGKRSSITINSVSYPFQDASLTQDCANAETTNYLTSGNWDSIAGVKSCTLAGTVICDPTQASYGTSAPVFDAGVTATATVVVSDGTASKTVIVTVRWDSVSWAIGVNDAVKVSVSGKGKVDTIWS